MRLIRYEHSKKPNEQLGLELDNTILDTKKLAQHLNLTIPETMTDLLSNVSRGLSQLEAVLDKAKELHFPIKDYTISKDAIRYLPVVEKPEKILCVGMNYIEHIKATNGDVPTSPVFFSKFPNALAAHNQPIPLPANAKRVDYEAELVIIIGKEIHNACKKIAQEAILGYTVGNDLSERAYQFQTSQWLIGKSYDHFAPTGPSLVTKDEIEDIQNLSILTKRNGSIVQDGTTKDMLFSVDTIVSQASQYMTLRPGDLIFTGTPRGVILEKQHDEPNWLSSQEAIDITIENIGTLSNTFI